MTIKKKIITMSLVGVLATGSVATYATDNNSLKIKTNIDRPMLQKVQTNSIGPVLKKLGFSGSKKREDEKFLAFLKKSDKERENYLQMQVSNGIISKDEKNEFEKFIIRSGAKLGDRDINQHVGENKSLIGRVLEIENITQKDVIYEKLMLFHNSNSEEKKNIIENAMKKELINENECKFLLEWCQGHK